VTTAQLPVSPSVEQTAPFGTTRAVRGPAGSASVRGLRRIAADATAVHAGGAAVADGIGDSPGAARAARIAADTAAELAGRVGSRHALLAARDAVLADPAAADAVLVVASGRTVSWVGDCRAYLVQDRGVLLLTHDHTAAQAFRDAGLPVNPAWEHLVTTTVAHADPDTLGHARVPAAGTLVLVSDGVHRAVDPETLAYLVRRAATPAAAARALVDTALLAGTTDNATATVLPLTG
jgi:PPM family protein phosphatase